MPNLFADLPAALPEEWLEVLVCGAGCRLERIVSRGHASPPGFWYDQPQAEWVVVLRGRAWLQLADEPTPRELGPGDHLILPAGCRHRVEATAANEETVWLALFYDPEPA